MKKRSLVRREDENWLHCRSSTTICSTAMMHDDGSPDISRWRTNGTQMTTVGQGHQQGLLSIFDSMADSN